MSVNINRNHHGVWSWKLSGTGTGMTFVDCAISVYSVYSFIATCDMCLHNPCCTLLAWSKSHVACPKPVLETFLQCPQEPGPILNERAAWKAVKNTWWLRPLEGHFKQTKPYHTISLKEITSCTAYFVQQWFFYIMCVYIAKSGTTFWTDWIWSSTPFVVDHKNPMYPQGPLSFAQDLWALKRSLIQQENSYNRNHFVVFISLCCRQTKKMISIETLS